MSGPIPDSDISPIPDAASAVFFGALGEGKLRIQVCDRCAAPQIGRLHCEQCASDEMSWVAASGRGVVYSFVIMHNSHYPAFEALYAAGIVELAEGPCLYARLEVPEVQIGTRVRIDFREEGQGYPGGFVFVADDR